MVIGRLGAGSTFGELALIEGTPQAFTVRAESTGEAFTVDAGTFQRLLVPVLATPSPPPRPVTPVRTLGPFRHLPSAVAAELAAGGSWVWVGPGVDVVRQGDPGATFYAVARGQLEAEQDGAVVGLLHAGDFFGEIPLLHDVPGTETVRALTPALLFAVPRHLFVRVLRVSFDGANLLSPPVAPAGPASLGSDR